MMRSITGALIFTFVLFTAFSASAFVADKSTFNAAAPGLVQLAGKCASGCSKKGGMCICSKPGSGCASTCTETQDGKCRCPQSARGLSTQPQRAPTSETPR